jgi:hypothetical protein
MHQASSEQLLQLPELARALETFTAASFAGRIAECERCGEERESGAVIRLPPDPLLRRDALSPADCDRP